ncbi:MAG: TrmH family RNA methyltransferase [Anaerolineales bacterium]
MAAYRTTGEGVGEIVFLEGHVSVRAALESRSRPIHRVLIARNNTSKPAGRVVRLAAAAGIAVEKVAPEEIAALAAGKSHGGLLAETGPRVVVELAALAAGPNPFVVMLDGVEDPFNFGQAVRALYAAGATGLVVRPRNWFTAAATVARASAGASERIPTAVAAAPEEAARVFHDHALAIACTAHRGAQPMHACDFTQPLFLLIGGERRGVTRSFREQADLRVAIPYGREFRQSLGTAAAAAVIGFEVARQRSELT